MTIRYEQAVPRDFLAIAALDRVAWKSNANSRFIPDGEHAWRIWAEHGLTFVARDGDAEHRLVGAVLAFPCVSGGYCLHKVMVEQAMRGRGIGSGLFRTLFTVLDRMGEDVFLTVDPANEAAIRLYEGWGFSERCFVAGYYRDEEDRLVLTRRASAAS